MADRDTFFFVHVMKTSGSSLVMYMRQNLSLERIFPVRSDGIRAWITTGPLLAVAPERRAGLRGYSGHWPAFAADLVGATRTFTILRDPVERTISHLKQQQRDHHPDWTLEQLYADEFTFAAFLDNLQTRVFAMRAEDGHDTFMAKLPLDASRLDMAKERLASLDVVGLCEDHPGAVRALQDTFGWDPPAKEWRVKVGHDVPVDGALRERIAEDMAWDRELYDFAAGLVAERSRAVPG